MPTAPDHGLLRDPRHSRSDLPGRPGGGHGPRAFVQDVSVDVPGRAHDMRYDAALNGSARDFVRRWIRRHEKPTFAFAPGLLLIGLLGWDGQFADPVSGAGPPGAIGGDKHAVDGMASGFLLPHIRVTGGELLLGLERCLIGFPVALRWPSRLSAAPSMPYIVVSQVIPKLALMPLFIVWFGFGMTSTVVITALICFFPLMENTLTGLQQVDPQRVNFSACSAPAAGRRSCA